MFFPIAKLWNGCYCAIENLTTVCLFCSTAIPIVLPRTRFDWCLLNARPYVAVYCGDFYNTEIWLHILDCLVCPFHSGTKWTIGKINIIWKDKISNHNLNCTLCNSWLLLFISMTGRSGDVQKMRSAIACRYILFEVDFSGLIVKLVMISGWYKFNDRFFAMKSEFFPASISSWDV
jgi:hypothetical protein